MKTLITLSTLLLLTSCGTLKQAYYEEGSKDWASLTSTSGKEIVHSLYLIGDGGELDDTINERNFVLDAVYNQLEADKTETSLVYLGDNVYPKGLPSKKSSTRSISEKILNAHIKLAEAHDGPTYFIPGNHDWNKHKKGGLKAIKRQEKYIETFDTKAHRIKFYPNDGCADPKVVKIHKDLVFVFLDSQWWLQDWRHEKKINRGCDIKSRGDLLKRVEEIFVDHKNDEIVVLMHHPIFTNGTHGGKYNLRHHLFPLTEIKHNLWIPLPLIGSLYPMYRQVTGSKQDNTNKINKDMIHGINDIAKKLRVNAIFAAGHEHGLQFFDKNRLQYIVSGGGSRKDYIKKGSGADYAHGARGYTKLLFHADFETWVEFYSVEGLDAPPVLEFRKMIRAPRAGTVEEESKYPPINTSTKTIAANEKFGAGGFKKLFLGEQYRDIWSTPVEAEVIDLESKLGGLTPIKKGGGMASNSLRMQHENGKQYILRSIKKDYTKLVPPGFENLKLLDVLADQNSASHPYNALIIPHLSKAAGVYYTHPKLVYLQHQRGLGNYNSQFPEELYLLEERPNGNWSDAAQFGHCEDIIGYTDLLETLRTKKNHFVDQEWVLKSRMFDLFIHDWDRHDDQWRWAHFEKDGKHVYRPIPRDRDQAFYKFVGVIPWYIANFVQKNFKTIKGDLKDVKNQAFNAKHFDRYFLHELEWSDWKTIINQMQSDLTDQDIDEAVSHFPKEVMLLNDDEELASLLKSRRDNLEKIGRRLYDFLSEEVEITGTDNDDIFEIDYVENGIIVKVFVDRKSKGPLLKYERLFSSDQTKEIRLYGLRGKDQFNISGNQRHAINLTIIGGEDKDKVNTDHPTVKPKVYDDLKGAEVAGSFIDKRSSDLEVNEYDRSGFKYNTNFPYIFFGNTVDDGFWIGGGVNWVKQGWRKDPFKSKQSLSFAVAPGSQDALMFNYNGQFTDVLGRLDFVPTVTLQSPQYENYFGLGNESTNPLRDIQYHWVRMKSLDVAPLLRKNIGSSGFIDFGPMYQFKNVQNTEGRVSDDPTNGLSADAFEERHFIGGQLNLGLSYLDSKVFTANGFDLNAGIQHWHEPSKGENITQLNASFAFYVKLVNRPALVFANNLGYDRVFGGEDLQFYHYANLGNNRGLRGYRNERFRGHTAFYHNVDLRLKLFEWDNNFLPMDIGLVGGYDYGRVSLEDIESDKWHRSQTIGIWMDILGLTIIQPYYSFNEEQNTFTLRMGFNF